VTKDPVREGTIAWALAKVEGEPRPRGTRDVRDYDIARQVLDYEAEVARLRDERDAARRSVTHLGLLLAEVANALKGRPDSEMDSHGWDDLAVIAAALRAPVTDMALCEQGRVSLRPGQIYRFSAMPGCSLCERDAAPYASEQPVKAP
jgi:hypothetical protein